MIALAWIALVVLASAYPAEVAISVWRRRRARRARAAAVGVVDLSQHRERLRGRTVIGKPSHRDGLSPALIAGEPFAWRGKIRGTGARTGRVDRRRLLRAVPPPAPAHVPAEIRNQAADVLAVMASTKNCDTAEIGEALGVETAAVALAGRAAMAWEPERSRRWSLSRWEGLHGQSGITNRAAEAEARIRSEGA